MYTVTLNAQDYKSTRKQISINNKTKKNTHAQLNEKRKKLMMNGSMG